MRTRIVLIAVAAFGGAFFVCGLPFCLTWAVLSEEPARVPAAFCLLALVLLVVVGMASLVFALFAVLAEVGDRGLSRAARRDVVRSAATLGVLAVVVPLILFFLEYLS